MDHTFDSLLFDAGVDYTPLPPPKVLPHAAAPHPRPGEEHVPQPGGGLFDAAADIGRDDDHRQRKPGGAAAAAGVFEANGVEFERVPPPQPKRKTKGKARLADGLKMGDDVVNEDGEDEEKEEFGEDKLERGGQGDGANSYVLEDGEEKGELPPWTGEEGEDEYEMWDEEEEGEEEVDPNILGIGIRVGFDMDEDLSF